MVEQQEDEIFINPLSDIMIKYLIGAEGTEPALMSFINAVLEDSEFKLVRNVDIKNPFNLRNFVLDKASILDIRAIDTEGKQFNIEVQSWSDDVFKNRSLYYWAKMYSGQLKKGEEYEILQPSISINLLNFELFKETEKVHNCFILKEKTDNFILTDHQVIHFLELPRFNKLAATGKLDEWMLYFKCEGRQDEEKKKLMADIMNNNKDIRKTHERYDVFRSDEEKRLYYEAREKYQRDYNYRMNRAKKDGIEQGTKDGKILDKQQVLIMLLTEKFGLSEDEEKYISSVKDPDKLDSALKETITAGTLEGVLSLLR